MDPEIMNVIELFVVALAAMIAFVQHRQKQVAENQAAEAKEIAATAMTGLSTAMALSIDSQQETANARAETAMARDQAETAKAASKKAGEEIAKVISFYDPADETVTSAPVGLPAGSFLMSATTKRWLTFDHSAEEQQSLLRQVSEAESKQLATYTLEVPSAWYEIEYGLVHASSKKMAKISKYA